MKNTPMSSMHARWKCEREAKAAKPAEPVARGTTSRGPANEDPGTAAEPDPTGEEDDS